MVLARIFLLFCLFVLKIEEKGAFEKGFEKQGKVLKRWGEGGVGVKGS